VRNELLYRDEEESNILNTIKGRRASWNGYNVCSDYLLQHVIEGTKEGRIEVTVRRGKRCKQLLDDVTDTRRYCKWNSKHQIAH
jgi:hypothetical protein